MARDGRELFCILVPLAQGKLVLPRGVVEEVRSLGDLRTLADSPPWLIGSVRWSRERIPLVSIEPLLDQPLKEPSRRSRMVVVRTPAGTLEPNVMAIHAQGFPYILRVTPELLEPAGDRAEGKMWTRIALGLERPVVPDLPELAAHTARSMAA